MDETPDILGLLGFSEPSDLEKARAMASALRRQQQAAQQQQFIGALGHMIGNKGVAAFGDAYAQQGAQSYQDAAGQLTKLEQVPQARLQRSLQQQQLTKAEADNAEAARVRDEMALPDSVLTKTRADLARRFGVQLPEGAPGNSITDKELELGEKAQANEESLRLRATLSANENARKLTESEWKKLAAEQAAADRKTKADEKYAQDLDKGLRGLREDIDPTLGRGKGSFGKDADLRVSAQKVLALVRPPGSAAPNYNLTVTQVPEFVQSVASMLSNGGQSHEAQLERLLPHTAGMSLAQKLEWVAGHPEDANVAAFIKQYADTAEREDKLAASRIRAGQLKRLTFHRGGFKSNKDEYLSAAHEYLNDLTPEQLEAAFMGQFNDAPPSPLPPDKAARLRELREKKAREAAGAK